jgi:N-acetyltransferase
MDWNLQPTLAGPGLTLSPLLPGMEEEFSSLMEPGCLDYFPSRPQSSDPADVAQHLSLRREEGIHFFLARILETGQPAACSSFMAVQPQNQSLEIGHTLIAKQWRGTWVNPEMKLLLLTYAFETLDAQRVQLKCDARNKRSWQAILKIGAKHEGVLRSLFLLQDGTRRDTAFFSILAEEWPGVRTNLQEFAASRRGSSV